MTVSAMCVGLFSSTTLFISTMSFVFGATIITMIFTLSNNDCLVSITIPTTTNTTNFHFDFDCPYNSIVYDFSLIFFTLLFAFGLTLLLSGFIFKYTRNERFNKSLLSLGFTIPYGSLLTAWIFFVEGGFKSCVENSNGVELDDAKCKTILEAQIQSFLIFFFTSIWLTFLVLYLSANHRLQTRNGNSRRKMSTIEKQTHIKRHLTFNALLCLFGFLAYLVTFENNEIISTCDGDGDGDDDDDGANIACLNVDYAYVQFVAVGMIDITMVCLIWIIYARVLCKIGEQRIEKIVEEAHHSEIDEQISISSSSRESDYSNNNIDNCGEEDLEAPLLPCAPPQQHHHIMAKAQLIM